MHEDVNLWCTGCQFVGSHWVTPAKRSNHEEEMYCTTTIKPLKSRKTILKAMLYHDDEHIKLINYS